MTSLGIRYKINRFQLGETGPPSLGGERVTVPPMTFYIRLSALCCSVVIDLENGVDVVRRPASSPDLMGRRWTYLLSLRVLLALGLVAIFLGFMGFMAVEQDPNMMVLGLYGTAASAFVMAMVGLLWITGDPSFGSVQREWQVQFLVVVGLILIGVGMCLASILLAVPYALVIYLYVSRLIKGAGTKAC